MYGWHRQKQPNIQTEKPTYLQNCQEILSIDNKQTLYKNTLENTWRNKHRKQKIIMKRDSSKFVKQQIYMQTY